MVRVVMLLLLGLLVMEMTLAHLTGKTRREGSGAQAAVLATGSVASAITAIAYQTSAVTHGNVGIWEKGTQAILPILHGRPLITESDPAVVIHTAPVGVLHASTVQSHSVA